MTQKLDIFEKVPLFSHLTIFWFEDNKMLRQISSFWQSFGQFCKKGNSQNGTNWKWYLDFFVKHQHLNRNWLPNYHFCQLVRDVEIFKCFPFKTNKGPLSFYYWLFVQDMAIIEILTKSQSFPTQIEGKLCRNSLEYHQSYIVLMGMNPNWMC